MLFPALVASPALPPVPREFRAAWVATVANIDWPSKPGLPAARQKAEMVRILDRARTLKLNAIVLQVRPAADALYASKYEPWSEYLTGAQGRNPGYDPLAFAVEEAHRRGIEMHVWLNPYRARHPSAKSPLAANHLYRTNPDVVKVYGKHLWMDPGEPVVQKRSRDVFLDIVRRYDVDGVHMDDYFYPYPENDAPFPDGNAYRKYGNGLTLGDWRRKNVDDFVKDLYTSVHAIKPWVQVGISPFGVYRPGIPNGITAGIDQYATLYADPRKWLRLGWVDYLAPQLYWPTAQKPQSYPVLLDYWYGQNVMNRHIYPGLFTSRLAPGEKPGYTPGEIVHQIALTRKGEGAGHIHFSVRSLMHNDRGVADTLRGSLYSRDALPPASPWLRTGTPPVPFGLERRGDTLAWAPPTEPVSHYVLWTRHGSQWTTRVLPGVSRSYPETGALAIGDLDAAALAAVDRYGNLSGAVFFPELDPS